MAQAMKAMLMGSVDQGEDMFQKKIEEEKEYYQKLL